MRAKSIDALRGFAIIMMVLCSTIGNWMLPNWMSHCQVPPGHGFDPSIYGITWVDLVFPFFLFSMGAAFPFSIGSKLERGASHLSLSLQALGRGLRLAFFAIYLQHCYPWSISPDGQTPTSWLITLFAFLLLFPMFLRIPGELSKLARRAIEWGAYAIGMALMVWLDSRNTGTVTFDPYKSNIIILLLANMAFFGTVVYIFTARNTLARLAVLPVLMAILLSENADGSWQQWLFNASPFPWLFKFDYLKYLFIIIPGSFAGEFIKNWIASRNTIDATAVTVTSRDTAINILIPITTTALIVINLWGLYSRSLLANFLLSIVMMIAIAVVAAKSSSHNRSLFTNLARCGAYLLFLGLCFEAFQGGIRKDDATYSYYFVTSGLAFYCLMGLVALCDVLHMDRLMALLTMAGKNPMIAYVATAMLLIPVLNLLHLMPVLDMLFCNAWCGLLHGIIVTGTAAGIAAFFTKINWFWRT